MNKFIQFSDDINDVLSYIYNNIENDYQYILNPESNQRAVYNGETLTIDSRLGAGITMPLELIPEVFLKKLAYKISKKLNRKKMPFKALSGTEIEIIQYKNTKLFISKLCRFTSAKEIMDFIKINPEAKIKIVDHVSGEDITGVALSRMLAEAIRADKATFNKTINSILKMVEFK